MIYQWDAATGKQLHPPSENSHVRGAISQIAVAPDGGRLYAAADDEKIHAWNLATGDKLPVAWPATDDLQAMCVSADGRRLLTVGSEQIAVRSTESGEQTLQIETDESLRSAAFADDGRLIIASDWEGSILAWDHSGRQRWAYRRENEEHPLDDVEHLAVSSDGKHLFAVGGQDGASPQGRRWRGRATRQPPGQPFHRDRRLAGG